MKTKIQKWGNSLAIRIPKLFSQEANIAYGAPVTLEIDDGRIIITPSVTPEYELNDLLNKITKKNIHTAIDEGISVGKEAW